MTPPAMGLYVGLMSGTSMDAVDAVLVDFSSGAARVRHDHTTAIPGALKQRLVEALDTSSLPALECWDLDAEVGELFATAANALLRDAGVRADEVSAIGSHGQTLFHAPERSPALTVQVGDPNRIASATGIVTVADFRRMDVAAGGQGAPLASLFHRAAFTGDRTRALLNLGGIANVTVLAADDAAPVLGFDTGPANTLLDLWCQRHLGESMDRDGRWAASGSVSPELLSALMSDAYFSRPPPKSTGREHFRLDWLDAILAGFPGVANADVQRTLVELTAVSAARALDEHANDVEEVFACGGGAMNPLLLERLAACQPERRVLTTEALGLPPGLVECVAFAWLARERMQAHAAGQPTVTGASRAATLGGVYRP